MEEFLKSFVSSPAVQFLAFALTAVSLVLAVVFYKKARKERAPTFFSWSRILIDGEPQFVGIQVIFKGIEQRKITVTHFYFWNAGKEAIRATDVSTVEPIEIRVPAGVGVLAAGVVKVSSPACKFTAGDPVQLAPDEPTKIPLKFEFLDYKDGAAIQVLHTGSDDTRLELVGKIVGVERFLETVGPPFTLPLLSLQVATILGSLLIGGAALYAISAGYADTVAKIAAWGTLGLGTVGVAGLIVIRQNSPPSRIRVYRY